ncbi:GNAT family N-acetyltransferase [Planococcus salinus]|uniref:GNAT family N-acetyltransferase n=1 Tax=Planococcus salinus TaxID=1848460 RepID=UPI001F026C98|nr:GNAT family N-acetyltransferase [Planococcus salinus]
MYWCKIARTEAEFDAIAKLNYETFVEEIPQHEKTTTGRRVDPFHNENTYVIVLKESTIVGMIALREQRPFSLDIKIGKVEEFISDLGKACEIRLLAVKKEYRNGRVFFLLARALADLCHEIGYDSAVISGTTRELKLYGQLGFQAFAKPVGAGDAVFIPMVTTRRTYEQSVAARLQTKKALFHPGPVQLTKELAAPFGELPLSHRSAAFQSVYKEVKEQLVQLTDAQPYMLNGSGTLANEAMLGQVKRLQGKGIVLVNGEFGRRMVRQAKRWQLDFEVMEKPWGDPFSCEEIKQKVADGSFCWMIMIHGETSMGMINEVDKISSLCCQYNIKLCLDCISSFGAVPLSLKDIWLATAVSGKAVGTMSGLAFVFANHPIGPDSLLPA